MCCLREGIDIGDDPTVVMDIQEHFAGFSVVLRTVIAPLHHEGLRAGGGIDFKLEHAVYLADATYLKDDPLEVMATK